MATNLNSHMLPLQPPFPLIYIGNPFFCVCKQIATLIQIKDSISFPYFSIPIVDSNNIFHGFPYDRTDSPDGKVVLLDINVGDKNIPAEKIIDSIQSINAPEELMAKVIGSFAAAIKNNGCSVYLGQSTTKMTIDFIIQNDKLVSIRMDIPLLKMSKCFSPDIDENEFEKFVAEIKMYWSLLGEFELECTWSKPEQRKDDKQMMTELERIIDKIKFLVDIYINENNYKLSDYSQEDFEQIKKYLKIVDCNGFKGINDEYFIGIAKYFLIHPYEYQKLWDKIVELGWLKYDKGLDCYVVNPSIRDT